ncbi:esterase/lipase family protein [Luteimonas sp. A277]
MANTIRPEIRADPPSVVPIILLPGIMGSNLRAQVQVELDGEVLASVGDPVWRVNSPTGVGLAWLGRSAAARKCLLDKDVLEVDPRGKIELSKSEAGGDQVALVADKRRRGWGTVSWAYYGSLLNWLEESLGNLGVASAADQGGAGSSEDAENRGVPNPELKRLMDTLVDRPIDGARQQPDPIRSNQIVELLDHSFPVYAFGYNWADCNLESGRKLAEYIDSVIKHHNDPEGEPASACGGVILLTHSMGGLVARAAAMEHGAESKILGVIHGVMPTHGAGAFYKRMVAGFSNEHTGFFDVMGRITAYALGKTAKETLPVLALNPGPLQLAPNHRYNGGKPWLVIKNHSGETIRRLPEVGPGEEIDPYEQIYSRTDVWWRAVNPQWLDPTGLALDPEGGFLDVLDQAESYHRKLADASGFHSRTFAHYSEDEAHACWGEVVWEMTPSRRNLWGMGWRTSEKDGSREGVPESWTVHRHKGTDHVVLRDPTGAEISARILKGADSGDGTVPAAASAAEVDPFCEISCSHEQGFDHNSDYLDDRVRSWVLNVIVRLVNA